MDITKLINCNSFLLIGPREMDNFFLIVTDVEFPRSEGNDASRPSPRSAVAARQIFTGPRNTIFIIIEYRLRFYPRQNWFFLFPFFFFFPFASIAYCTINNVSS